MFTFCRRCLQNQLFQKSKGLFDRRFSLIASNNQRQNVHLRKSRLKTDSMLARQDEKVCLAYCTSESYNLDQLRQYFINDSHTYTIGDLPRDATDVLYVKKQNNIASTQTSIKEIFLFRRLGAFVCWNINENEIDKLRQVLNEYELEPYNEKDILDEMELLNYETTTERDTSLKNGDIYLNTECNLESQVLDKLTFSNALALSVRLNMWETALDNFSLSLRHIPERMKEGYKVRMSREEVLQRIGELLTLRHQINLYSDLLITPDFYWDREDLEKLYAKTCNYLEVGKRTKVINEKLNLCSELVEMLRSHLNERHSHRLEWMIIVLITIEVVFEVAHWLERMI